MCMFRLNFSMYMYYFFLLCRKGVKDEWRSSVYCTHMDNWAMKKKENT